MNHRWTQLVFLYKSYHSKIIQMKKAEVASSPCLFLKVNVILWMAKVHKGRNWAWFTVTFSQPTLNVLNKVETLSRPIWCSLLGMLNSKTQTVSSLLLFQHRYGFHVGPIISNIFLINIKSTQGKNCKSNTHSHHLAREMVIMSTLDAPEWMSVSSSPIPATQKTQFWVLFFIIV